MTWGDVAFEMTIRSPVIFRVLLKGTKFASGGTGGGTRRDGADCGAGATLGFSVVSTFWLNG